VWEDAQVDNILKVEFRADGGGIDLEPSVYAIGNDDVTRTVAEHSAGSGCDPPRSLPNVALSSDRELIETAGETGFSFTTANHREMRFESENDLRAFILDVVLPDIERRAHVASKQAVRDYVRGRLAEGDPEWTSFVATHDRWR